MARKIERGANAQPAAPAAKAAPEKKPAEPKPEAKKPVQQVATQNRSSIPYRIGAFVLWALAIICEVFGILALTKSFSIRFTHNGNTNMVITLIIAIVLDLAFAITAAQLWKKANRIKPMSGKNKFLFYVWSELGVIMACICFIPLIVLLLKDKQLDKKSKLLVTIIAVVALLITGVASADFNPITAEEKEEAESQITSEVYWTTFGHKYHLDQDCPYIRDSANLYGGEVKEAIETGRTAICSYCARHYGEGLDLEALNVEEGVVEDVAAAPAA